MLLNLDLILVALHVFVCMLLSGHVIILIALDILLLLSLTVSVGYVTPAETAENPSVG